MTPALDTHQLVGQVVVRSRHKKGWSAEHAAQQARVAQKTWARVENGERVRAQSLMSIANQLGLADDALLTALSQPAGYVELARSLGVAVPSSTGGDALVVEVGTAHETDSAGPATALTAETTFGQPAPGTWVPVAGPGASRLQLVGMLATNLAMDPNRSDLGEEVRVLLAKYSEELVVRRVEPGA